MTANPTLVKMRGIDDESVKQINLLHEELDRLMSRAGLGVFNPVIYQEIEKIEYDLQRLWNFDVDSKFHVHKLLYKFRSLWCGRVFKCEETGEELRIPENVKERDLFHIGKGFIDVGVLDGYCRYGGVREVVNPGVTTATRSTTE